MAPIRVGIIGLSAAPEWSKGTSWAARAHLPYLLHNTGKYEIVALSNSSVEAAEASIKKFDLPKTVKAYGSATDLANDPDVDLVVCSVRVDKHHSTLLPAIEAGKDVYCEWPLGADPQQAKELLQKAEEKGVRTMVGLQGRMNPRISKIKELIAQGRIGKVLSVAVLTASGLDGGEAYPPAIRYVGEKKVGGNAGTVVFAHAFDSVLCALDSELSSFNSIVDSQREFMQLLDADHNPGEFVKKDAPDHVSIHGRVASNNAILTYHMRAGSPFPGTPQFLFRIYGEDGEIELAVDAWIPQVESENELLRVWNSKTNEVETIKVDDELKDLPMLARNVGRLYEAFHPDSRAEYPDFAHAVKRHELLDEMGMYIH